MGRWLVLAVVLCVWGLITHGTWAGSGDGPHYLVIAHSLIFDADLDVANNYREAPPIIGGDGFEAGSHARLSNGVLRPVHDVGMPLVLAPIVGAAYLAADRLGDVLPPALLERARLNETLLLRHQISLVMAVVTGLLGRELFLFLLGMGTDRRRAFAWALGLTLTAPLLSHSYIFFTEIASALLVLAVFRRLTFQPPRDALAAGVVGLLVGLLLLVHIRNVGAVAALLAIAGLRFHQGAIPARALTPLLVGFVGLAALRTGVTYVLWGTLVTTPHTAVAGVGSMGAMGLEVFERLTGLLFDREYGLLAYAPAYCLAVPGLVALARMRVPWLPGLLLVVGAYIVPVLLPFVNGHGWTGGWSPAARMLVPVVPLLGIAVFAYGMRGWRPVVVAFAVAQVAIAAYTWQFPYTLWNEGDGVATLPAVAWLPSWTLEGQGAAFAAALALLVAFGYACSRPSVLGLAGPPATGEPAD